MNEIKYSNKHKIQSTYSDTNDEIYDILSQDSFLMLNRKMISTLGLELSTFITFLVDKEKYYKHNSKLDKDGYFYLTNSDLVLNTGIKASRINSLKNEAIEKNLLFLKKSGIPLKTYYKLNLLEIKNIISNVKSSLDLAYERLINDEKLDLSDLSSFSISSLEPKTYRELRLMCKKLKISYTGKDNKSDLINKILNLENSKDIELEKIEKTQLNLSNIENIDFSDSDLLNSFNFSSIRLICKKLKISYTGKDNKSDLISKIISHSTHQEKILVDNVNDLVDKDFENLKSLILSFQELNIKWNKSLENIIHKFYKKYGYKLSYEFLSSNYKNLIENKNNITNLSGCFISLIKKEQRQLNSSSISKEKSKETEEVDKLVDIFNDKENEKDIQFFFSLDDYEKLQIEETAINDYIKSKNTTIDSILLIKAKNSTLYYKTLENYILPLLKNYKNISG